MTTTVIIKNHGHPVRVTESFSHGDPYVSKMDAGHSGEITAHVWPGKTLLVEEIEHQVAPAPAAAAEDTAETNE